MSILSAQAQDIEASQELINELRAALPEVRFDRMSRLLYSTDASIYQMMPIGVAFPQNSDDVRAAVEIAARHHIPLLPRGSGSSLAGQAIGHALILDFTRHMDQVLEINPAAKTVRAQPGITLGRLNRSLQAHGLMYGPDPASADRATVGGVMGNNSTGAHSILYGMTADHVIDAHVILSDASSATFDSFDPDEWGLRGKRPGLEGGIYRSLAQLMEKYAEQIATRYPRTFRNVAGYNLNLLSDSNRPNLASLIVGSEGTLGVITEATLNLVPTPKVKHLAMVHFSDLRAALEAVPRILESEPSAIEILDKMLLDLTRERIEYRRLLTFIEGDPVVVLLVEYAGDTEQILDHGITRLRKTLGELKHKDPVVMVSDARQQANVWFVRSVGLGILMSIRGDAKPIPFIEDAAVPVEHLADYVSRIDNFSKEVGVERVAMYAHASAGCIHVRPLINLKAETGLRQLRQIAEKSLALVMEYGGTTSGEHGEGLARGEFSERLFGPELTQAFRHVKAVFDPQGMFNPGKVVDVPRMDDETHLRFGSDYAVPLAPQSTRLNFQQEGGFSGAVEMCNGSGVCRQHGQGVMCPPFQATRDEAYSTRGMANALRSAMMGLLGPEGMTSEELYPILDLCISCKACKAECPSAVDMAKLKAEFLHNYHQVHGIPLRDRVFGNIARLNKLGQPLRPLTNLLLGGSTRWLQTKLGIAPQRSIPPLARETFSQWFRRRKKTSGSKQVVLFHDTFMEHNHPKVGRAAVRVLEAAGFEPILVERRQCCGRPAVSKGFLDEAARLARHNIALLAPYAEQGISIVGCEPSCMTMLVDEYVSLVPTAQAKSVARMALPIEEFLVGEREKETFKLSLSDRPRTIHFHGHCQQKAVFGTDSTIAMLRMLPNAHVELIQSGCCGMAGSFGYEAEHYDLSIKLAEMSLAPAVRAASEDAIIAATGISCRDQINHTTGRAALHPIEILASALD